MPPLPTKSEQDCLKKAKAFNRNNLKRGSWVYTRILKRFWEFTTTDCTLNPYKPQTLNPDPVTEAPSRV